MIIVVIIGWMLFAWFDAKEEAAWTYPFRSFDWMAFEPEKMKQNRKAHNNGAAAILVMLILTSGLFALAGGVWYWFLVAFAVSGLSYWLVFDIAYALAIGQKWYYLGSTASTDKLVKNGKVKAFICAGLIVGIVVGYLLFVG
jgi:hypothetical protein